MDASPYRRLPPERPPSEPPWPTWKRLLVGYAAITLVTGLPILSVVFAATIANKLGCPLDESGSRPCIALGFDLGALLNEMAGGAFYALATVPFGIIAAIAFTTFVLIKARDRQRRDGARPEQS